jgi:hypothetical protein
MQTVLMTCLNFLFQMGGITCHFQFMTLALRPSGWLTMVFPRQNEWNVTDAGLFMTTRVDCG